MTGHHDAGPDVLASGTDRPRRTWPARVVLGGLLAVAALALVGPHLAAELEHLVRETVTVPRAADRPAAVGLRVLREAGLDGEVRERFAACWPPGWVVDQQPGAGQEVERGARVLLTAAGESSIRGVCPQGVATDTDRLLSARFVAFALKPGGRELRWADPVTILAPGEQRTVPAADAGDPATWATPSRDLLASATVLGDSWIVQAAETRRCPGPPRFDHLRRLAVSDTDPTGAPDRRFDDCRPGAAFTLYVDLDYRIHGVQVPGPR